MVAHLCSVKVPGADTFEFHVQNTKGSMLPRSRQLQVLQAMGAGATHILMLDSDMTFPRDTAHRLMAHDKECVAANCATKLIPAQPTAKLKGEGKIGVPCYTDPGSKGLQKVWRVGTGVMMLKASVFRKVKQPWFNMEWQPDLEQYYGEDWFLCKKMEKAGINIWVDHDLSKQVGHVGQLEYTHQYVGEIQGAA